MDNTDGTESPFTHHPWTMVGIGGLADLFSLIERQPGVDDYGVRVCAVDIPLSKRDSFKRVLDLLTYDSSEVEECWKAKINWTEGDEMVTVYGEDGSFVSVKWGDKIDPDTTPQQTKLDTEKKAEIQAEIARLQKLLTDNG